MSSWRVFEIAKLGLSENLTHLPSVIFCQKFPTRKIPDIQYSLQYMSIVHVYHVIFD